MQLTIQVTDESKLDFLLQFFRETSFVEVLSPASLKISNGAAAQKTVRRKKLSAEQQECVEDIRQGLIEVELHRQGKIKLQTLQEFLAEQA